MGLPLQAQLAAVLVASAVARASVLPLPADAVGPLLVAVAARDLLLPEAAQPGQLALPRPGRDEGAGAGVDVAAGAWGCAPTAVALRACHCHSLALAFVGLAAAGRWQLRLLPLGVVASMLQPRAAVMGLPR